MLSEIGRRDDKSITFTDEYIWLGARPLAKLSRKIKVNGDTATAEITYIHTDHLATPRSATNESGDTVWNWNSDAFGVSRADRDPDGDGNKTKLRLRFSGQYFDDESGLHYNHHRDYDPKLGRYIQSDPIGLWGGTNRYSYVNANPVNLTDSLGLGADDPVLPRVWTGSRLASLYGGSSSVASYSGGRSGGGGGGGGGSYRGPSTSTGGSCVVGSPCVGTGQIGALTTFEAGIVWG